MSFRPVIRMGWVVLLCLAGCITTEIDDCPRASIYSVDDPLMAGGAVAFLLIRNMKKTA